MQKVTALIILIMILISIGLFWDWYQVHYLEAEKTFATAYNISNIARRSALLSVYGIGVGMVIMAGGIDLSIGSVIALTGYLTSYFMNQVGISWPLLLLIVAAIGAGIGLLHGVLVSVGRLQPFVVTLCGLLVYRGLARVFSNDQTGSLGDQFGFLKSLTQGVVAGVPMPVWTALLIAAGAHVFLNYTIWGRYIYAIGNNEQASLYSGINVRFTKILTYVICSLLGAWSGVLEASYVGSITPSGTGTFYELYAIAAAVLGGCSLRGGEGTILGILLGSITIQLIRNLPNLMGIPSTFDYVVLGLVLMAGALVDMVIERYRGRKLQQPRT